MSEQIILLPDNSAENKPGSKGTAVLKFEKKAAFTASKKEILSALLLIIPVYLYVLRLQTDSELLRTVLMAVFSAGVILITEYMYSDVKRNGDQIIWTVCFAAAAASCAMPHRFVFSKSQTYFLTFVFCFWYIFARSGKMAAGKSSRYAFIDVPCACLIIPVRYSILWIRTVVYSIGKTGRNGKSGNKALGWGFGAAALCVILFAAALNLLVNADSLFADALSKAANHFDVIFRMFSENTVFRIVMTFIVTSFMYGLIGGSVRISEDKRRKITVATENALRKIRRLPENFWTVVIALFSVMYIAFFVFQASYLFGAFTGHLPEGFIISQYAREGFFELCKVIAVNFVLLWFATRMAVTDKKKGKCFIAACIALLAESILFAVVAFSKLAYYISVYGFTPRRIQSTWLVCVLAAGCILWIINVIKDKEVFRIWLYTGGLSLAAIMLIR